MKKFDKEQDFSFEIELRAIVKNKDYDEAMKKIVDAVNRVNGGNVIIKKIEGSHRTVKI